MPPFQYLTIQDVLWINLQITLKVEKFDYARLEEAVFYQYALGNNSGLVPQATRFLSGFLRMKPFEVGNEATAFIACAAYLRLNGKLLIADKAGTQALLSSVPTSLEPHITDAPAGEHLDAQVAIQEALAAFDGALPALAG